MVNFNTHDYHKEFINLCSNQISNLTKEIHILLSQVYNSYYTLDKDYNYLIKYNINLYDIINLKIKGNTIELINIDIDEQLFISNYNDLLSRIDTINKLTTELSSYVFYQKIPYVIFKVVLYSTNFEITRLLLQGESFQYPKLGNVYIGRVPYDSSIPDWGQSMKFKQNLIDNGQQIKDGNNPLGKAWLIDNGLDRDDFILLRWSKHSSKLHNKSPYRLVPCTFGNIYGKILTKIYTISELLNNTKTGLFDKIIHIYRYHEDYSKTMYPYVNILKPKK